jgi:hypothetical protein
MRKEILDALKAKFTGVSDAILGRIADKLAKTATTAEQVATAVEGVTFQQAVRTYEQRTTIRYQVSEISAFYPDCW